MNTSQFQLPRQMARNWKFCGNLGQGAMGQVVKVQHVDTERLGAAKLINESLLEMPTAVQRFLREATIAQKLKSPFVVTTLEVFTGDSKSLPYIIFEYVAGGNLDSLMKERQLTKDESLDYIEKIAAGLDSAHSSGIIHRDLKPENILVFMPGHPKIADFGLATLNEARDKLTVTGQMMGTPAYMSPEQLEGKRVDVRSDIYTLGLIAFELLTGKRPFKAGDLTTIIQMRLNKETPPLRTVAPEVAPPIAAVVDQCLLQDPEKRPQSVAEFIKRFRSGRSSSSIMAKSSIEATVGSQIHNLIMQGTAETGQLKNTLQTSTIHPDSDQSAKGRNTPPVTTGKMKTNAPDADATIEAEAREQSAQTKTSQTPVTSPPRTDKKPPKEKTQKRFSTREKVPPRSLRTYALAGMTLAAFLVVFWVLYITTSSTNTPALTVFKSRIIESTPLSVTMAIETPRSEVAMITIWDKAGRRKEYLTTTESLLQGEDNSAVNQSSEPGSPLWRIHLNELAPGSRYKYMLTDYKGLKSLVKNFKTRDLAQELTVLKKTPTAVAIAITPDFSGKQSIVINAFLSGTSQEGKLPFTSTVINGDFKKGEPYPVTIDGLRPYSSYVFSLAIPANLDGFQSEIPLQISCETPGITETKIHTMTKDKVDDDIFSNFIPAAGKSWQEGINANTACDRIENSIVYSLDNFGIYRYDLVARKILTEVKTPEKRNLVLTVKDRKLFCLESNFLPKEVEPGKEHLAGRTVTIKVYDSYTLALIHAIPTDAYCYENALYIHKDLAIVWIRTPENSTIGNLAAYSTTTGKLLWKTKETFWAAKNIITTSGQLWAQGTNSTLYAYDCYKTHSAAESKESTVPEPLLLHSKDLKGRIYEDPVELTQSMAYFLYDGTIWMLNKETMEKTGVINVGEPVQCAVAKDGILYCATRGVSRKDLREGVDVNGSVVVIDVKDPDNCKKLRTIRSPGRFNNPKGYCSLYNGYLYYADILDNVNCIDVKKGNFLYTFKCINDCSINLFPDEEGVFYGHSASIIYHINDRTPSYQ